VWLAGHLQVKNKTLCHVDTAQLMEIAQEWADKISSKT